MDDINYEIVKRIKNPLDKIHYIMAFRRCGNILNHDAHNIYSYSYDRIDFSILKYLFLYLNLITINKILNHIHHLPFEFIALAANKYDCNDCLELDWWAISKQVSLTNDFIHKYSNKLKWNCLARCVSNLSIDLFEKHVFQTANSYRWIVHNKVAYMDKNKYMWSNLLEHNKTLTTEFIEKYDEFVNWEGLCKNKYINFSNKWWLSVLPKCKYFIFYKPHISEKFMVLLLQSLFVSLIDDSFKNLMGMKFPFFLCNIRRNLYWKTKNNKNSMVKTVHFIEFLNQDVYAYYRNSDDDSDDNYKSIILEYKRPWEVRYHRLKMEAENHIKELNKYNLGCSLTSELIIQFKIDKDYINFQYMNKTNTQIPYHLH